MTRPLEHPLLPATIDGAAAPRPFDHAAFHGFATEPGVPRYNGWTPECQRTFLQAVAEGFTVRQACAIVGLSKQSAYALRQTPRGAAFALGWQAAVLLSRNALADEMMERAFHGHRETVTGDDGRMITRHRFDNRVGLAMLGRLDRMADSAAKEATHAAARLVAADFDQYLALVAGDAGPARAGVFLGARLDAEAAMPASEDDLAPIRALARADRWLRTRTDIAQGVVTADLDPAARAGWTADQWLRAEAAGLLRLAGPEVAPEEDEASRDRSGQGGQPNPAAFVDEPVWWDEDKEEWRTHFPPPEGFDGEEDGAFGDDTYSRTLSAAERAAIDATTERDRAARLAVEGRERDDFFARLVGEGMESEPAKEAVEARPAVARRRARARPRSG